MSTSSVVKWYPVSEVSMFPLNEGKRVKFGDYDIAVFNAGGTFKAVDNACPHKQGPLADGIVAGDSVFCPLHSLRIDLSSGCAQGGEGKVRCYPVKVFNEKVYVAFEEGKFSQC